MFEKTHVCLTAFYHINYKCIFPWVVLSLAQGIFHCPRAFAEENWLGRRLPSRWRETANAPVCWCCCPRSISTARMWTITAKKIQAEAGMRELEICPCRAEQTQIGKPECISLSKVMLASKGITDFSHLQEKEDCYLFRVGGWNYLDWPYQQCSVFLIVDCTDPILIFSLSCLPLFLS